MNYLNIRARTYSCMHTQEDISNQFTNMRIIGKGAYAVVTVGVDKDTSVHIAMKKFERKHQKNVIPELPIDCIREVAILRFLGNHPNVIGMLGISIVQHVPIMFMNALKTSLEHLFGARGMHEHGVNPKYATRLVRQLSDGVQYMHDQGFMHRDLKPANILATNTCLLTCSLKIADMGLSCRYIKGRANTLEVVSYWWRAPEIFLCDFFYTQSIDNWSIGIMFLQMLIGCKIHRFFAKKEEHQLSNIFKLRGNPMNGTLGTKWGDLCIFDTECVSILNSTLSLNPQYRSVYFDESWYDNQHCKSSNAFKSFDPYDDHANKATLIVNAWNAATHVNGNERTEIVDKIIDISIHSTYSLRTVHSAVDILDRFICFENTLPLNKLDIVGITSLYIALSLYEAHAPELKDHHENCGCVCSLNDIIEMEKHICNTLGYNLFSPLFVDIICETLSPTSGYKLLEWTFCLSLFLPGCMVKPYTTAHHFHQFAMQVYNKITTKASHTLEDVVLFMTNSLKMDTFRKECDTWFSGETPETYTLKQCMLYDNKNIQDVVFKTHEHTVTLNYCVPPTTSCCVHTAHPPQKRRL